MRLLKFLLPLLASTLCFAAQPDRISGPIDSTQMVPLQNHVSPLAQPRYEKGLIDSSTPLRVTMLFTPTAAQHSALQKLLADQQDPKSANFHKWLTPEQYAARFGLSQNDIDKVTAWLQSQGLKVTYVARGRDSISFSGDAAQVQAAFKTQIHSYEIKGEMHFANSTSPMIPAALSGIIGGFRGLHNFVPKGMIVPHNPNSAILHPDYTFTTTGGTFTRLAPGDLATIYDITPLYQASPTIDGTGQKLVIAGQTDIHLADLTFFRTDFTLPAITGCTTNTTTDVITACDSTYFQLVIPTTAKDPGVNPGDLSESDLDIEISGSVARNAKIIFVTSDLNSGGVNTSISWAIDNTLAPVISISYGLCEAYATPPSLTIQDGEFQKGASEGISIFAASGDGAAATCDAFFRDAVAKYGPSVSYPASSPSVTAVGGTEFDEGTGTYWGSTNGANGGSVLTNGPMNGYIPELAWNDTAAAGGPNGTGGGPSNCVNGTGTTMVGGNPFVLCVKPPNGGFAKPAYQTALTPADSVRDVPDISFSASNFNDPYIVCTAQSEILGDPNVPTSTCVNGITTALATYNSAFGGTSASTPVAAGMAALLNQYLGAANGLGNMNTELYKLFGSNPSAFHDILAGTSTLTGDTSDNIVPCVGGQPSFEPTALQCSAAMGKNGTFGYTAGPGYDMVTGLGTIDFNTLFIAWAASSFNFTLAAGSASPTSIPAGQSTSVTLTIAPVNGSTQTINFTNSTSSNPQSCSAGLPAGALCSFNPPSVTLDGTNSQTVTLTISTAANMTVPSGVQTLTVTGTASGAGGTSHTANVNLTVTATNQSFTLTTTAATFPVTVGGTAVVNVTVANPVTGGGSPIPFVGATTALPLTYTCSGTPSLPTAEINCQISPGGGNTPTNATALTITLVTTAPTSQLSPPLGGSRIFYALLLPGLFGVVFAAGSRTRGLRLLSLIVVLGLSTLWLGSCGGSSSNTHPKNPGTPPNTYAVTITATTGGANPVTNSSTPLTFNLAVQ